MEKKNTWIGDALLADITLTKDLCQSYVDFYNDRGAFGSRSKSKVLVDISLLDALLKKHRDPEDFHQLRQSLYGIYCCSMADIVQRMEKYTKLLAEDMNQNCPKLVLKGLEVYLNPLGQELLQVVLGQLIRNSMDHSFPNLKKSFKY